METTLLLVTVFWKVLCATCPGVSLRNPRRWGSFSISSGERAPSFCGGPPSEPRGILWRLPQALVHTCRVAAAWCGPGGGVQTRVVP